MLRRVKGGWRKIEFKPVEYLKGKLTGRNPPEPKEDSSLAVVQNDTEKLSDLSQRPDT